MRLTCALLCDAATVREGLLHVLGGGVTNSGRSGFPAPLNLFLAVSLLLDDDEAERSHSLSISVRTESGQQVGGLDGGFEVTRNDDLPSPGEFGAALALDLRAFRLPEPGLYSVKTIIDDDEIVALPLLVEDTASST